MVDQHFLQGFLRINNIAEDASVEEIREVLVRARWSEEDIERAVSLCVEKGDQQLERREETVSSSRMSALLGTDVVLDPRERRRGSLWGTVLKVFVGLAAALLVAAIVGAGLMYYLETGPFQAAAEGIL